MSNSCTDIYIHTHILIHTVHNLDTTYLYNVCTRWEYIFPYFQSIKYPGKIISESLQGNEPWGPPRVAQKKPKLYYRFDSSFLLLPTDLMYAYRHTHTHTHTHTLTLRHDIGFKDTVNRSKIDTLQA